MRSLILKFLPGSFSWRLIETRAESGRRISKRVVSSGKLVFERLETVGRGRQSKEPPVTTTKRRRRICP